MKLRYLFLIVFIFNSFRLLGFQNEQDEKYLVVIMDSTGLGNQVGYNLCKTQDSLKKEAYILNVRYKLKKNLKSSIGSDADFLFVFYIFPKYKNLKFDILNKSDSILNQTVKNFSNIRDTLLKTGSVDHFNFKPLVSSNGKLYEFKDAEIFAQAFNLKEDPQYFPEYKPLSSNRYELNLLSKPYSEYDVELLKRKIIKDTSSLTHFDYGGFDGKWNVKMINKAEKKIDFWINMVRVATGAYSFGRFANEIRFKVNVGVTDFKLEPLMPIFDEKYMTKYQDQRIAFNFKEFIDIKTVLQY